MTDAPERLTRFKDGSLLSGIYRSGTLGALPKDEYIRADLSTYDAGIEAAALVVNNSFPDYEGGCSLQDQAARDLRDQIADDIRALSPTPTPPVTVQEAARALLDQTPKALEAGIEALKAAADNGHGADVCLAHALCALAEQEGE
jgi:hypothetical protein